MNSTISVDEINLQRLLERSKRLSRDQLQKNAHKLSSAVNHLEVLFSRLQDDKSLDRDVLFQYGRDVHLLKGIVMAEQQRSVEEKIRILDLLPSTGQLGIQSGKNLEFTNVKDHIPIEQVRARNRAVYTADLRAQLLHGGSQRMGQSGDLNEDLLAHDAMQSELAMELLRMATAMKETFSIASNVIREDNTALTRLQTVADTNRARLEVEGRRLEHHAYASFFDWLLLLVVIAVVITFIGMVLMMRIFPKPRIY